MLCGLADNIHCCDSICGESIMPSNSSLQSEGGDNQRGEQKVTGAPQQDMDGQVSTPVFYLTCDRRSRRAAVCLFICSLSVHRGVSFRPRLRGEKTNETTNEIRERE